MVATTFWRGGQQISAKEALLIASQFPPQQFCLRIEGGGGVCLDRQCSLWPRLFGWEWWSQWRGPDGSTHEVRVWTSYRGQRGRVRVWRCPGGADPLFRRQKIVDQRFTGFPLDRLLLAEAQVPTGWRKVGA